MNRTISEWIELSEGCLHDGPPKRKDYETILLINTCKLKESPKGLYLLRSTGADWLYAETEEEMAEKILSYASQPTVRRLITGLESNDFARLPKQVRNPPRSIIDGTDAIYQSPRSVN